MNIEDLTIKQAREIAALLGGGGSLATPHPLLGKNVFVRTVTHAHTGRLVDVTPHDLVLVDVAWIACTSRLADFIRDGKLETSAGNAEIEPFPDEQPVFINRGAVVDMTEWRHGLPRAQR